MKAKKTPAKLAQTWCALSLLHSKIEHHTETALQHKHGLSAREFSALALLAEQSCDSIRMHELAERLVLSNSATTRLINRLEERGLLMRTLCSQDRRGIYTQITPEGQTLLAEARPTNDRALQEALDGAEAIGELAPLVAVIRGL